MAKHAKTFHTNKGYNFVAVASIVTSPFLKYEFVSNFSYVIWTIARPCTPLLFIWKRIKLTFSFIWNKTNGNFLTTWVPVFQVVLFFIRSMIRVQVRFLDNFFQYFKNTDVKEHSWRIINVDIGIFQYLKSPISLGSGFNITSGFFIGWILVVQRPELGLIFIECHICCLSSGIWRSYRLRLSNFLICIM